MILVLALHFAVAALAPLLTRRLGPRAFLVLGLVPLASSIWLVTQASTVLDEGAVRDSFSWVPGLGLDFTFRLDAFAWVMAMLISGVGTLIFWYAASYFSHPTRPLGTFAGSLLAFSGSMLGLVLADNVLALFTFWELTTITSFLLIGFEHERGSSRAVALQALLVTSVGGLALLGGLVMIGSEAGTYELSAILADPPSSGVVTAGLVLVLVGCFTKSAQFPFQFWLPGAMAAPTPVSAYLHSATMVKAGIYLVARFAPAFADDVVWRPLLVPVALVTMVFGAVVALRRYDLKQILAYGTISALGFLMLLFGLGLPEVTAVATGVLVAHALYKATLFMVTGVVDHEAHTRDICRLDGLARRMPVLATVAALAALSMAAVPALAGWATKEAAYAELLRIPYSWEWVVVAGVVLGSVLTVAYSGRVWFGAFGPAFSAPGRRVEPPVDADHVHRPSVAFVAPAAVLAGLGLVLGVVTTPLEAVVQDAGRALDPLAPAAKVVLWPGVKLALWLSLLTLALGLALVLARGAVERWQRRLPSFPPGERAYSATVAGLLRLGRWNAATMQSGSLPRYLAIILSTLVLVPGAVLVAGNLDLPDDLVIADDAVQVVLAVIIVLSALAAATAARRFSAILFLSGVGAGMATLFIDYGAPDLALTQFLVETATMVVFVLVVRHLPDRFRRPARSFAVRRAIVAGLVGLFVTAMLLASSAARTAPRTASELYEERALPDAGGRNIVNTILVDFRGYDTMGEITVLVVTALGAVSIALAGRPRQRELQPVDEEAAA